MSYEGDLHFQSKGVTFPPLRGQRRDVDGGQRSVIGLNRWQRNFKK